MKRNTKPILFLLITAIVASIVAASLQFASRSRDGQQDAQNRKLSKVNPEGIPLVDYEGGKSFESKGRKAKNARHNGQNGFVENVYRGGEVVLINDWEVGLSALPID